MKASAFLLLVLLASGCAHKPPQAVYFVMVDRFSNGDTGNDHAVDLEDPQAFHGGDIQGVIDHLDWIQSMGFDTIWLSPVWAMRTSKWNGYGAFHGYWTWDLNRIEQRFGGEESLKKLREELGNRNMKLVLDLVLNHVGPDAPLLKEHPDWFHRRGGVKDWNDPQQLVMNDVHGLPDLATEDPQVFRYLLESTRHWTQTLHPEGYRMDAVKHLPLKFWTMFNGQTDGEKLGEMLDGDAGSIAHTWAEGDFTSMFDFPLAFAIADVFCRAESPAKLAAVLTNDRRYPNPQRLVTLVDNHDLPRLMSVCGGDVDKVKEALTFLFAMRGVPSMIWGTEVGLDGAKEPDNRKQMVFDALHPLHVHVTEQLTKRMESKALSEGRAEVLEADQNHVLIARIADDGSTETVRVENGHVTVEAIAPLLPPTGTVKVRFEGQGAVCGSGPELGDWDLKKARPMPFEVELPLRGVFEFKKIVDGQWEDGPNHLMFVEKPTVQAL